MANSLQGESHRTPRYCRRQFSRCRIEVGMHPAAGEGLWGTQREVPSFLYAMPSSSGRVFLEETCLVAKPALPFATLKRRLHRRMAAMGLKVRPLPLSACRHHSYTRQAAPQAISSANGKS